MNETIICDTIEDLPMVAETLLSHCGDNKVLLFYGEMGVGKTTFINALCNHLQVIDSPSSPTFSIVNEYLTTLGDTVFHFDFYRIKDEMEALDFGYEEYLYSGNLCFVEWPEKIAGLLPSKALEIHMKIEDSKRVFNIKNRLY